MDPLRSSLLTVMLFGGLLTGLLVYNEFTQSTPPERDLSGSQENALQLSKQIDFDLNTTQKALDSLSFNTYWQSSPITEWAYWLNTQLELYQATGLSLLGVHSIKKNSLSFEKSIALNQLPNINEALKALYKKKSQITRLQLFRDIPAIIILTPIKNVKNKIIGALIGVKNLDSKTLKPFHFTMRVPIAVIRDNKVETKSIEGSVDLNNFNLVNVSLPKEINDATLKLVLLVKSPNFIPMTIVYFIFGILLTLLCAFIVWKQFNSANKIIIQLNESIEPQLSTNDKINALTFIQDEVADTNLNRLIKTIRENFEYFAKQQKSINAELTKAQQSEEHLKSTTHSLASERDSAMAAPRLRSEFLSRMGDEITTPMTSVVSMLDLLAEYQLQAEAKQILIIAMRSTQTLVDNLNNILDFSKLDANLLSLSTHQFNIYDLVDNMAIELAHDAEQKKLNLTASTDPQVPITILADEHKIKQVLRNLLGNAIRFTRQGDVSLYVDVINKNNEYLLRFTIKDSGVGIPKEAQKSLFDSLERSTKLTNASFAGRLRLIVSKHIVELMGGEIGVISDNKNGSQFWFTVKLEA